MKNRFKMNLLLIERSILFEIIVVTIYIGLFAIKKYVLHFPINFGSFNKILIAYVDDVQRKILAAIAFLTIFIAITLVYELTWRLFHDSLKNFFKSIRLTYLLRRFMIRQSNHEGESTVKISSYNKAVKSLIVDFNKNDFAVKMKTAIDLEGQKLLEADLEKLREQIAVCTASYHTSLFERQGKYWICTGSKI